VLSGCASREADWWDAMLNAEYQARRAEARRFDADTGARPLPSAEALRDMQRAWITFRDATCSFEASQWGGGTGANPAFLNCIMRMTAEQALYLRGAGFGG